MKIYIAAPWAHRGDMPGISERFEQSGHEITWKCWTTPDIPENADRNKELTLQAHNDMNGVIDADLLVLVNSAKSEGKSVEQGIAISNRKPIIAIGKLGAVSQNVFHYLPQYKWVETVEDAVNAVNLLQWAVDNAS